MPLKFLFHGTTDLLVAKIRIPLRAYISIINTHMIQLKNVHIRWDDYVVIFNRLSKSWCCASIEVSVKTNVFTDI